MVRVIKTDVKSGTSVELNVTEKVWKRITEVPSVFGANLKWAKASPTKKVFDAGAPHKAHDDLAETKPIPAEYSKDAYEYDCKKGKELFTSGEHSQAIVYFERALKFQPRNQYIRKLLKEIKDGKGATD